MSYSYSTATPISYDHQMAPLGYENVQQRKKSSIPLTIGGSIVGIGTGAFIANRKNPFISSNGEAKDSFTKSVYERHIKKNDSAAKEVYEQANTLLKKINSVKTPEELKSLLESNKDAAKSFLDSLGQTSDEYIATVTQDNLSSNKDTIKKSIETLKKNRLQSMKNTIQSCWNKEKKCFEKPDSVADDVFKAIKKSTNGVKANLILKYAVIAGAIGGVTTYIAQKIIQAKSSQQ